MSLVVGATGQLGELIVQDLQRMGQRVRVLVRDQSAADLFLSAGCDIAWGDLKDSATLRSACRGIDAVVTTANATARGGQDTIDSVDRVGNQNLISAAVAEEVGRFVFVSALGAAPDNPLPLLQAKGEAEAYLRQSGMAWTVLQPNLFFDKLPMGVVAGPALAGEPVRLVGEGQRRHSLVAMRDVAAFAVAALTGNRGVGQTLVLGGPQPISWRDMVTAFERELQRPIPVETVPLGEPIPGMPDFFTELLTALETYDSPIDSSGLAASFGITQTSLGDFVQSVVAGARQASARVD